MRESVPSIDLGISNFQLDLDQFGPVFRYRVTFRLAAVPHPYRGEGSAASPSQCFEAAMIYLAMSVREAPIEKEL